MRSGADPGGGLAQRAGRPGHRAQHRLTQQIERIFSSGAYAVPRFGPARWLPDGTAYAIVERSTSAPSGFDIVRYDAATGARSVVMPAARLVPPGATAPLAIEDYAWSGDGTRLLIFTNTRKVWRDNTRGDYWVLDVASGALKKMGGPAPEASLMFAKFSPDATRVAYVTGNNIYVESIADGTRVALTSDGSATTINGTSDWVYEEELGVRDCFRWSPDGRRIAYWQFDSTGVGMFSLVNATDTLYPQVTLLPYPKAGTMNSAARIGVVGADWRAHDLDEDAGRPAQHLPGQPGVGRRVPRGHAAAEPPAEPERPPAGRCLDRGDPPRLSRRIEGLGGRRSGALDRQWPGVSVGE